MAKNESWASEKFKIFGRAAFIKLDRPKAFEEGQDPRYEATTLLDPADSAGMDGIKLIVKQASELCKTHYGVVPIALKRLAYQFIKGYPAPDPSAKEDDIKIAFYHGDKKDYDGFAGMFVAPAHNKMKVAIANRKGVAVDPGEPQFPYSGCYVYTSLNLWLHSGQTMKKYGKRVGINLRGVQFAKDGPAFGAGSIAAEDEFDALEDSAEAVTSEDWE